MRVATIAELCRYPVKGMHGEMLKQVELDAYGIAGDRRFAIRSEGAPRGKPLLSGAERAAMLLFTGTGSGADTAVITPSGSRFGVDDPALLPAMRQTLPGNHALELIQSETPLTDVRPVALLGCATIAQLSSELGTNVDARRFRANILLQMEDGSTAESTGFSEDRLVGSVIRLGDTAQLLVTERDPRCRIVILDPATAAASPALMKHLDRHHQGRVGVYGAVKKTGLLRVGDRVEVL